MAYATTLRMAKKYPEKQKARSILRYALITGKVSKSACMFCSSEKVEAHHPDYTKPLEVMWLCPECHRKLEGRQKYA
jgi:hypothetical protein